MQGSGEGGRTTGEHERRCPECGALNIEDARWCGQCFRSLIQPVPETAPASASETAGDHDAGSVQEAVPGPGAEAATPQVAAEMAPDPTWPCPACGNENPLESDVCEVCGTSFAAMMRQGETPERIDPKEATKWSLIFPGLGHMKAGRGPDGLARGVLFVLVASMAILTGFSGLSTPVGVGIFVLYLIATIAIYAGSAVEASQIAQGGQPFIGARQLLWVTVGLILASVALLAVSAAVAAR